MEFKSPIDSHKVNIIEESKSILDGNGFEIDLGISTNTEKCIGYSGYVEDLREWSVFIRNGKIAIKGILNKQNSEVTKVYDAGIVFNCIKKNWIKTEKGDYRLIGPPQRKTKMNKRLYEYWYITEEFPKNFSKLLNYRK